MRKYESYKHYLLATGAKDTPETYVKYRVAVEKLNRRECGTEEDVSLNLPLISDMARKGYYARFTRPVPAVL